MLRSPLFGRLVMWIFCRGTIAVFAEKKVSDDVQIRKIIKLRILRGGGYLAEHDLF